MKKYKTKISRKRAEVLIMLIDILVLDEEDLTLEQRVIIANLADVSNDLKRRLIDVKNEYKVTMSAAQSLAVCCLYIWYEANRDTDIGNYLHNIRNEISQKFNL